MIFVYMGQYNIDSFGSLLWDNCILGHLTVRNPNFDVFLISNNISITFDCEVNYPRMRDCVNWASRSDIYVTDKCYTFKSNSNKIFSRKLD